MRPGALWRDLSVWRRALKSAIWPRPWVLRRGAACPRPAAFHGLPGHIANPNHDQMMKDRRQRLRGAAIRTLSRLTAMVTAGALALAPVAVPAQENKGPRLLRDTEIEQLLRDYTRPILRIAGLEKQNIQVVIINDGGFNAFVAD